MATEKSYIEYVLEQLTGLPEIVCKKMFGEYLVYASGRPAVLVCDNNCFVKILPQTDVLLSDAEKGYPYDGAKLHYMLDIDDRERAEEVVKVLSRLAPNKKKSK